MGLELKEISKKFSDFNILTNFSAGDGELLTLLGPSGCGKTTTLQIIAGIIGPDKGKILLNGKDITRQAPWERNIGIVFQDYALFPHMNVADNISYGLRIRKLPQSEIRLILKKYLSLVQLTGYENRSIESLSGGEKQRVALARALAPDPGLLLLDEPLSALDTGMRKMLRKEIRRIQQELDITTIYITHDQEEALSISDKIVIMHDGRVEQTGTPWEIYNHPKSIFTANFMGETNKIPCRIKSVSESEGILLVSDQINTSFHLPYLDQTENDKEYYLVFKPQGTKILDNKRDKAGLNEIKGNVLSTEFTGRCLTVEFNCNGLILKTEKSELKEENAIKMEKDTPITVWIDPDKCWVVPR